MSYKIVVYKFSETDLEKVVALADRSNNKCDSDKE